MASNSQKQEGDFTESDTKETAISNTAMVGLRTNCCGNQKLNYFMLLTKKHKRKEQNES